MFTYLEAIINAWVAVFEDGEGNQNHLPSDRLAAWIENNRPDAITSGRSIERMVTAALPKS